MHQIKWYWTKGFLPKLKDQGSHVLDVLCAIAIFSVILAVFLAYFYPWIAPKVPEDDPSYRVHSIQK